MMQSQLHSLLTVTAAVKLLFKSVLVNQFSYRNRCMVTKVVLVTSYMYLDNRNDDSSTGSQTCFMDQSYFLAFTYCTFMSLNRPEEAHCMC